VSLVKLQASKMVQDTVGLVVVVTLLLNPGNLTVVQKGRGKGCADMCHETTAVKTGEWMKVQHPQNRNKNLS